jgi:hypothetical protein
MEIDLPRDHAGCELAEEVLRTSGRLRLKVNGSSMLPAIWPGDVLRIVRERLDAISVGDVILFARDGMLTAHRIIGRRDAGPGGRGSGVGNRESGLGERVGPVSPPGSEVESGPRWTTRGDSLPNPDQPDLASDEILGRVVSVERGGRELPPAQTSLGRIAARLCAHSDPALRIVLKFRRTWVVSRREL